MWDRVPEDEGHERFDMLCDTGAWKEMISMGASTGMISNLSSNATDEAGKNLSELIKHAQPIEVAIQDEIVNQGKTMAETGAGKVLSKHLRQTQAEAEHKLHELHETLRKVEEAKSKPKSRRWWPGTRVVREVQGRDPRLQQQRVQVDQKAGQLRKKLHKKQKAAGLREQGVIRAQELAAEESKPQDIMAREQEARAERLQRERHLEHLNTVLTQFPTSAAKIIAAILSSREPLPVQTLAELLNLSPQHLRAALYGLRAVLFIPEDDKKEPLCFIDQSSVDYITSATLPIQISTSYGHTVLAHACLLQFTNGLHFNVSRSTSSYNGNSGEKPTKHDQIPHSLLYACISWAYHLCDASESSTRNAFIDSFLRSKLLFWLEVLGTFGEARLASELLKVVAQ